MINYTINLWDSKIVNLKCQEMAEDGSRSFSNIKFHITKLHREEALIKMRYTSFVVWTVLMRRSIEFLSN